MITIFPVFTPCFTTEQCSQTRGLNFGWSCTEPGVGLCDPHGSRPTQDILRLYDPMTLTLNRNSAKNNSSPFIRKNFSLGALLGQGMTEQKQIVVTKASGSIEGTHGSKIILINSFSFIRSFIAKHSSALHCCSDSNKYIRYRNTHAFSNVCSIIML